MILYHYRPIERALKEIGDCTLHFANCAELNDPLEGYVRVFWQGDNAAWEGICVNNGELVPSARFNYTTLPKQESRLAGWLYRSAAAPCRR